MALRPMSLRYCMPLERDGANALVGAVDSVGEVAAAGDHREHSAAGRDDCPSRSAVPACIDVAALPCSASAIPAIDWPDSDDSG